MAETVQQLLIKFKTAQEQRPGSYKKLDDAFKHFLKDGHDCEFKSTVAVVTQEFAQASAAIREVEAKLRELNHPTIAQLIRDLQTLEKEKLQLTTQMQIEAKHNHDKRDEYDGFEEAEYEVRLAESKRRMTGIVESINDVLEALHIEQITLLGAK